MTLAAFVQPINCAVLETKSLDIVPSNRASYLREMGVGENKCKTSLCTMRDLAFLIFYVEKQEKATFHTPLPQLL